MKFPQNSSVAILQGTYIESNFINAAADSIFGKLYTDGRVRPFKDRRTILDTVLKEPDLAYHWDLEGAPLTEEYANCEYGSAWASTLPMYISMAVVKDSHLTKILNDEIIHYQETGILNILIQHVSTISPMCGETSLAEASALSYSQLEGLFALLCASAAISVIIIIFERLTSYLSKKDSISQRENQLHKVPHKIKRVHFHPA